MPAGGYSTFEFQPGRDEVSTKIGYPHLTNQIARFHYVTVENDIDTIPIPVGEQMAFFANN